MEDSIDLGRLLRNHQKKHKSKPSQFGSVASGVQKRLETNLKFRKSSRLSVFDSIRNISKCEGSPVKPSAPVSNAQSKIEHRRQQLEKWKEQKDKQKKDAAAQKKKPFIAGVPRAPLKFEPPPPIPKPKPSTSGRVTRSQASRNSTKPKETKESKSLSLSFAPKNASFRPPEIKNATTLPNLVPSKMKKSKSHNFTFEPILPSSLVQTKQTRSKTVKPTPAETKPVQNKQADKKRNTRVTKPVQSSSSSEMEPIAEVSPILMSKSTRKSLPAPNSPIIVKKTPRKSLLKNNKDFTPKNQVPKSESSSEEKLRSPKNIAMTPEQIAEEAKKISPCVTLSRGKSKARAEMKKKLDEGLLDEDASDMNNVDHFRQQLASEIKRMTEMCDTWDKILEQTVLPDAIQEAVLSAVGQARLLMSQKLAQFGSLVERCARPEHGQAIVTPADLHGFWDMVFMQVTNVDLRFKNLEELRARGWVEIQPVEIMKKVVKHNVKKVAKPTGGPSRLRDLIAAARKAKKEQSEAPAEVPVIQEPSSTPTESSEGSKTFEAGFFTVRSPIRSPAARSSLSTPASKNSLLKHVLSSEAKKSASKNSASFAMLRASVMGKNVECEGIAPLPPTPTLAPINLYATPGRSILKSTNTKSARKSIRVAFNRSDIALDTSFKDLENDPNQDNKINGIEELPLDSGLSMHVEKDKENSRRKSKLVRQDAEEEDRSPIVTRSRRKSGTDAVTPRRSVRKMVLEEHEDNVESVQRSSRRKRQQVN